MGLIPAAPTSFVTGNKGLKKRLLSLIARATNLLSLAGMTTAEDSFIVWHSRSPSSCPLQHAQIMGGTLVLSMAPLALCACATDCQPGGAVAVAQRSY